MQIGENAQVATEDIAAGPAPLQARWRTRGPRGTRKSGRLAVRVRIYVSGRALKSPLLGKEEIQGRSYAARKRLLGSPPLIKGGRIGPKRLKLMPRGSG